MQSYYFFEIRRINIEIKLYFCGQFHGTTMKKTLSSICAVVLIAVAIVLSTAGLNGCKPNKEAAVDTLDTDSLAIDSDAPETLPAEADNLFNDFLYGFMSSREIQLSRIKWPLECISRGHRTYKEEKQWATELFFLPQGYYTLILMDDNQRSFQADTTLTHAVVEKIFLDKDIIQQYEFDKKDGKWMLCRIREIGFKQSPNASFLQFYNRFATDEKFQMQSISDPLQFTGPNPDDSQDNIDGIITAEQWPVFAPQLPRDVLYNIVYGNFIPHGRQRVMLICNVASEYGSELTFAHHAKGWKLDKIVM